MAVGIAGRLVVARALDDGYTVEVTWVSSDGTRNATSMLYAAPALRRLGTRLHPRHHLHPVRESGASLRAAGWRALSPSGPLDLAGMPPSRPRDDARYQTTQRTLWEATSGPRPPAWRHRELSTRCTTSAAVPGQPCRLIGVGASLYRPHRERLPAAIFGGRP